MQSKIFKAGTGEKLQYLVHEYNDNTLRFVVHYPVIIDADALQEATKALLFSVDILHASFSSGTFSSQWKTNETLSVNDYFQHIKTTDDHMMECAKNQAVQPIKPDSAAQIKCSLIQNQKESIVVLNISHLCADGSDGKYLLQKLTEAYQLFRQNGTCNGLIVKNGRRDAEQVYELLSRKEVWSLIKNPTTGIHSPFPYPTTGEGSPDAVFCIIPANQMQKARQKAKKIGATTNDLLLAGVYRAYAALPTVERSAPISLMSMMDLRRHCKNGDSEGLSNLSGALPTVLMNGVSGTIEETILEIVKETSEIKARPLAGLDGMPLLHGAMRILPMPFLQRISKKVYGSMCIGLTNLGNINCNALVLDDIKPDWGWFGGPLKKKPSMQISAVSFDGACALAVMGQYTTEDAEALLAFLNKAAEEITSYV